MSRYFAWLNTLAFLIFTGSLIVPPATAAVTVAGPAAVRIPASADSGVATLRLRGDSAESLILSGGELVDRVTKEALPGTVAFEPAALDVKPGLTYEIKVTASKILFEGEAEVDVLNQGEKIGSLVVTRAPLAVTLADAQALFRPGEKTAITLRNDARYPYDLRWMVQMGVHKYCGAGKVCEATDKWSPIKIFPKDGASIEIEPPGDWFDWSGLFSERTKEATVWLAFREELPRRALKLKAHLQGRFYLGQTLWLLIFLPIAALFYLIVRHWGPKIVQYWGPSMQKLRVMLGPVEMLLSIIFVAFVTFLLLAGIMGEITMLRAGIMALLGGLTLWFAWHFIDAMRSDGPPRIDSHWGGLGGGLGGWRFSASLVYLISASAFGVLVIVGALQSLPHKQDSGTGVSSTQSLVTPATKDLPKEQSKEPSKEAPKQQSMEQPKEQSKERTTTSPSVSK